MADQRREGHECRASGRRSGGRGPRPSWTAHSSVLDEPASGYKSITVEERAMKKLMLILAAVLTGCASLQNTPQQDLIWNAYPLCKAEIRNNVQILRVDPDGRYWMQC